jgi:hypothetical protein
MLADVRPCAGRCRPCAKGRGQTVADPQHSPGNCRASATGSRSASAPPVRTDRQYRPGPGRNHFQPVCSGEPRGRAMSCRLPTSEWRGKTTIRQFAQGGLGQLTAPWLHDHVHGARRSLPASDREDGLPSPTLPCPPVEPVDSFRRQFVEKRVELLRRSYRTGI